MAASRLAFMVNSFFCRNRLLAAVASLPFLSCPAFTSALAMSLSSCFLFNSFFFSALSNVRRLRRSAVRSARRLAASARSCFLAFCSISYLTDANFLLSAASSCFVFFLFVFFSTSSRLLFANSCKRLRWSLASFAL